MMELWMWIVAGVAGYLAAGVGFVWLSLPRIWDGARRDYAWSEVHQRDSVMLYAWGLLLTWPMVALVVGAVDAMEALVDSRDPDRKHRERAKLADDIRKLEQENEL